jgi:Leucine-rich repeat (LRR) protein
LHQAVNAKTYSIDAKNLAGFSVEQISKIAPKITGLKISDSDLSDEQFVSLIENCINLCHLKIETNATSLPDSWPFIEQLETLDCNYCRNLKKLPDNMLELRELYCCGCPVESLPNNIPELRVLNCIFCPVKSLPDNMPELRELDCCGCPVESLPGNMLQLEVLKCSASLLKVSLAICCS